MSREHHQTAQTRKDTLFSIEQLMERKGIREKGPAYRPNESFILANVYDGSHSGVRIPTGRVNPWRNGQMVLRWAASAFLEAEKSFRRIQGHHVSGCSKRSLKTRSPARKHHRWLDDEPEPPSSFN